MNGDVLFIAGGMAIGIAALFAPAIVSHLRWRLQVRRLPKGIEIHWGQPRL